LLAAFAPSGRAFRPKFGAGIATDEAGVVDSVEHLSRPAMGDHPELRDKGPYPLFEALKASFPVVGLAALVLFTADEQKIILALFARLDADVVIRIFCIPIGRIEQRSARQRKGDNIGSVRRGLGVQDDAIGD